MSLIKKILGIDELPTENGTQNKDNSLESSSQVRCPYCNNSLEKRPSRKKKCPHCGNYIVVKRGHLLTEDQKAIGVWLDRLAPLGVTKHLFKQSHKQLAERFGSPPSVNDTIWHVLNSLVATTTDHSRAKMIYSEMAQLVRGEGKNPKPYLAKASKHALLGLKEAGIRRVRVQTVRDEFVCPQCRKLTKKTFTIEQALNELPVPNACENKQDSCRCSYSAVLNS